MNDAHTDDLHTEESSSNRRGKYGREESTHTAHGNQMAVFLIQMDEMAKPGADASTDLKGCPFTAGRTSAQMGERGTDKDQGASLAGASWDVRMDCRILLVPLSFSILQTLYKNPISSPDTGSR